MIQRYLGRISGPLLDRIDLHIEVPAVPYRELRGKEEGATSAELRARVERARAFQQARGFYNSRIPVRELRKLCALDDAGERTLEMAVRRLGLSARAHDRILKVARTIADLVILLATIGRLFAQSPSASPDHPWRSPSERETITEVQSLAPQSLRIDSGKAYSLAELVDLAESHNQKPESPGRAHAFKPRRSESLAASYYMARISHA